MSFFPRDPEETLNQVSAEQRADQEAYEAAQRVEEAWRREAFLIQSVLRSRGWKHVEALLHAALSHITERALTPTPSVHRTTARALQAQGAIEVVNKFKEALEIASRVEKAEPKTAGLAAKESNEQPAITD